ncbi:SHOCT domain-containing protein [Candidatus Pelagibacter sp.]|nr:SHOCT domain-containing protein [Candidatus Pelagibacter sp.]
MEKIIFLSLAIPILVFVFYLGGNAIMNGYKAKIDNRQKENRENETEDILSNNDQLSDELKKLNDLLQNGVLTQDEFEKAKKKILDN